MSFFLGIFAFTIAYCSAFNLCKEPVFTYKYENKQPFSYFGYAVNLTVDGVLIKAVDKPKIGEKTSTKFEVYKCALNSSLCEKFNDPVDAHKFVEHPVEDGALACTTMAHSNINLQMTDICGGKTQVENDNFRNTFCQEHSLTAKLVIVNEQLSFNSKDVAIIIGVPRINNWNGGIVLYNRRRHEYSAFEDPIFADIDEFYTASSVRSAEMGDSVYVISAPRLIGKVYLIQLTTSMEFINIFTGTQIGESFGSSVIADDFNNDGFTDIAISAPLHTQDFVGENGVVYIYYNHNGFFSVPQMLFIPSSTCINARFGTAISKVGDLNGDGYNDIAISAPFEESGVVYIFNGGKHGISSLARDRILKREEGPRPWFGFGLSQGVDVDDNCFNDLIIGAPNINTAFMFKSYPIVSIKPEITILSDGTSGMSAPKINSKTVSLCYHFEIRQPCPISKVEVFVHMILDSRLTSNDSLDHPFQIERTKTCHYLELTAVDLVDTETPLRISFNHSLNKVSRKSDDFCKDCVTIDPQESTIVRQDIYFSSKCREKEVDKLEYAVEYLTKSPYLIEETREIAVELQIKRDHNCSLPICIEVDNANVTFQDFPENCFKLNGTIIECEHRIIPRFVVILDTKNNNRNKLNLDIGICKSPDTKRFSIEFLKKCNVEIVGESKPHDISLDYKHTPLHSLNQTISVYNRGPSAIKSVKFDILIPKNFTLSSFNYKLIDETFLNITGRFEQFDVVQSEKTIPQEKHSNILKLCAEVQNVSFLLLHINLKNLEPIAEPFQINISFNLNMNDIRRLKQQNIAIVSSIQVESSEYFEITQISNPETIISTMPQSVIEHYTGAVITGIIVQLFITVVLYRLKICKRKRPRALETSNVIPKVIAERRSYSPNFFMTEMESLAAMDEISD